MVIGASAGGLAALEPFFEHLPNDSGMAFVVVTHQSPDHTSVLPKLLGRYASMETVSIDSSVTIAPNRVYVAPPGNWVLFKDDLLLLQAFDAQRGGPLPIDAAFRSLAHTHAERGIAIVLSGNGSDGSLGLAEVKGAYGMVIAPVSPPTERKRAVAYRLVRGARAQSRQRARPCAGARRAAAYARDHRSGRALAALELRSARRDLE